MRPRTARVERPVAVEVGQEQPFDAAVLLLLHEREVEHADQPALRQVDEHLQPFPGRLLAWRPLDDEVVDGADFDLGIGHVATLSS